MVSEMLVIFSRLDSKESPRNISERKEIISVFKVGKRM
jgi:hypothetical protein